MPDALWTFVEGLNWVSVASGLLSAAMLSAVLAWVYRSSAKSADQCATTGAFLLSYAPILKWVFAIASLFFPALLVGTMYFDPPSRWDPALGDWVAFAIYGPFIALSIAGCREVFTARVVVSAFGISGQFPWIGHRSVSWNEITSVTFSPGMMWFVVESRGGTRLRLSKLLRGLPDLGREVRSNLEPEVYIGADPHFDAPLR